MKQTVTFTMFADAFRSYGRNDNFSYEGLQALFDYLEELGDDIGEEIELDVIAICCDYSEYSVQEAIEYFELTADDLGLADELADHREAVVEDRMEALSDELLDEDTEAALREQYEEEAQSLGLDALIEEEADAVKVAALEYFNYHSQAIDIPNSDRFILLAY